MDMIERVAKAIWDDACPGMSWGEVDKLTYEGWARAAIEAMREPTDEMLAAADDAWVGADRAPPEIEYRMMIDSVLKKA